MYVLKLNEKECRVIIQGLTCLTADSANVNNFPIRNIKKLINKFEAMNECKVKSLGGKYALEFKGDIVTEFNKEKHKRIPREFNSIKEAKDYIAKNFVSVMYKL